MKKFVAAVSWHRCRILSNDNVSVSSLNEAETAIVGNVVTKAKSVDEVVLEFADMAPYALALLGTIYRFVIIFHFIRLVRQTSVMRNKDIENSRMLKTLFLVPVVWRFFGCKGHSDIMDKIAWSLNVIYIRGLLY